MSLNMLHSAKNPFYLTFNHTLFNVIDHKGKPWMLPEQVGQWLELENPRNATLKLYYRHPEDFGPAETDEIEMDIEMNNPDYRTRSGYGSRSENQESRRQVDDAIQQKQTRHTRRVKVRIFSLRGAHLLGMFARSPVARDFRRWILDQLEMKGADSSFFRPYRDIADYEFGKHPRWKQIYELLFIGEPTAKIAPRVGCAVSTVRRAIREMRRARLIRDDEFARMVQCQREYSKILRKTHAERQQELFPQ